VEFSLFQGDCIEVMRGLPDNSVDSVCTDPPYGLKFMGHRWDCDVPSVDVWREVFRVLKPGGHLLSFSGTRTYHRVTERLPDSYDGELLGLHDGGWKQRVGAAVIPTGRWPANLMHDGSDEVVSAFPDSKGQQGDLKGHSKSRKSPNGCFGEMAAAADHPARNDSGSAARFFYSSKASKKDRGEGNNHPTVKPTDVCRWLLRLVTPPGGTSLDMYCGSGSFGKAAILEGFNWIGIDRDRDEEGNSLGYLDIARARCLDAQCEASGL